MARSLTKAARNLELDETYRFLQRDAERTIAQSDTSRTDSINIVKVNSSYHSYDGISMFRMRMAITSPSLAPKAVISKSKGVGNNSFSQSLELQREIIKNKYVYQRNLLDKDRQKQEIRQLPEKYRYRKTVLPCERCPY